MDRPTIAGLIGRKQPGRKVHGIAAALLPYEAEGKIAVDAFQKHLPEEGQFAFLSKPFTLKQLVAEVKKTLVQ